MAAITDLMTRPVYGMRQVDDLLSLHPGTASRWIDGYDRRDRHYAPVVRSETTGSDIVTWGEFVETRLLSEYRDRGASIQKMRPVVERLREEYKTPYPLTAAQPLLLGRDLIAQIQDEINLETELRLVVIRSGQLVLADPADRFYASILWSPDGYATSLTPDALAQRVTMDPLVAFGEPVVRAVRTSTISSEFRAGSSPAFIADAYSLDVDEVNDALRYELARAA